MLPSVWPSTAWISGRWRCWGGVQIWNQTKRDQVSTSESTRDDDPLRQRKQGKSCFGCSLTLRKIAVSFCHCSCWCSLASLQSEASLSCGRGGETSDKKRPTFLGNLSKTKGGDVTSTGSTWIHFVFTTVASVLIFLLSLSNLENDHLRLTHIT